MAEILATFDTIISGGGAVTTEAWVDIGLIPTGKKIWFGYATLIAEDKNLTFELRSNLSTKSAGTVAETILHDYSGASGGSSIDRDLYRDGNINLFSVVSTGVEHWWLRVKSGSSNSGLYDYIIYYTLY